MNLLGNAMIVVNIHVVYKVVYYYTYSGNDRMKQK